MAAPNPFAHTLTSLAVGGTQYKYYSLNALQDKRLNKVRGRMCPARRLRVPPCCVTRAFAPPRTVAVLDPCPPRIGRAQLR